MMKKLIVKIIIIQIIRIEEKKEEVKVKVKIIIIIIIEEDQIQNLILEERITTRSYSGNRRSYSYNNRRERNYRERNSNENNWSYEENGIMKISIDFIVPDRLVSFLIGKNGENVRTIMSKTGALINFSKEYNDDSKLNTINGTGRICNLKGTSQQNANAMQMICELIIKQEQRFNTNNNPKKNK